MPGTFIFTAEVSARAEPLDGNAESELNGDFASIRFANYRSVAISLRFIAIASSSLTACRSWHATPFPGNKKATPAIRIAFIISNDWKLEHEASPDKQDACPESYNHSQRGWLRDDGYFQTGIVESNIVRIIILHSGKGRHNDG